MKHVIVLAVLVLAGCSQPDEPDTGPNDVVDENPCNNAYFVSCDNNRDAKHMLEAYGLHQFTNTSLRVARPLVADGIITWAQGGFGDPVDYGALAPATGQRASYQAPQSMVQHGPFPGGGQVLVAETPRGFQENGYSQEPYNRSVLKLWHPIANQTVTMTKPQGLPLVPAGFDGRYGLFHLSAPVTHRFGAGVLDSWTGAYLDLWPIRANDDSYFGGPLIHQAIGGGYVFLSMLYEHATGGDNAIIAINLTTGQRTEILNVTNHAIQEMDASDDYLVIVATIDGKYGAWAWSIKDEAWLFVQEGRERDLVGPRVAGEWIAYLELQGSGLDILVGFHLPTKTHHELVHEGAVQYLHWDTDGTYFVVSGQPTLSSPLRFENTQLYWKSLPVVNVEA